MDRRFVCTDCELKWFVPARDAAEDDPTRCGECGGLLRPLDPQPADPPGWPRRHP